MYSGLLPEKPCHFSSQLLFWQGTAAFWLAAVSAQNPHQNQKKKFCGRRKIRTSFCPLVIVEGHSRWTPRSGRAHRLRKRSQRFIRARRQHSGLCHGRFCTRVAPGAARPPRPNLNAPHSTFPPTLALFCTPVFSIGGRHRNKRYASGEPSLTALLPCLRECRAEAPEVSK